MLHLRIDALHVLDAPGYSACAAVAAPYQVGPTLAMGDFSWSPTIPCSWLLFTDIGRRIPKDALDVTGNQPIVAMVSRKLVHFV